MLGLAANEKSLRLGPVPLAVPEAIGERGFPMVPFCPCNGGERRLAPGPPGPPACPLVEPINSSVGAKGREMDDSGAAPGVEGTPLSGTEEFWMDERVGTCDALCLAEPELDRVICT